MIAFVAIGILAGALSFATALFMGASFWFALMLYSLVGAASVLVAAVIPVVFGKKTAGGVEVSQDLAPDLAADLIPAAPLSPAVAEPQAYLAQGGMRILAVDDDPIILGLIPRIAAEVGCADTTISSSGAQALSLLEQSFRPYDCLLLDINMPGIDGIELCGRIRQIPAYRDTPIIMLTAMKDVDHLDRAFRAGASDYISKPFDVIAFGTCLRTVQDRIVQAQVEQADQAGTAAKAAVREDEDWVVPAPGSIAGVETLIEHAALQNYLTRLSGVALSGAYVLAVGTEHTADGPVALAPVVAAITAAFPKQPCVMSYAGDGQFIVVSNSATMPDPSALERSIEDALRTQSGPDLASALTINVGMAVRPGSNRTLRAKTAIDSALRLSASRAAGRKTVARAFGGLRS